MRTGRGGEAAGRWRRRDSRQFRWRGCAGPPLLAFWSDAEVSRPKQAKTADVREQAVGRRDEPTPTPAEIDERACQQL
jgi:hypothetical protein